MYLKKLALKLLNKKNTLTPNAAIIIVLAIGVFAHWPALISDSIMWDDWIILSWITQSRLDWVFQFYHNYGVTPYFLVDLPLVILLHDIASSILVAKITYFLGVLINSVLIMLLSKKIAHGNLIFATLAGTLAVCFPAISGEGFHISMLIYYFFIPLFLMGMLTFIKIALSSESSPAVRIIALAMLLLSFSLNSLLVMFYALLPAIFYATLQNKKQSLYSLLITIKTFLIRHVDFLVTPLIFWILKEIFMPRLGIYARYNKINFDWIGILQSCKRLIPDILQTILFVPLSIKFIFWITTLIFAIVILISKNIPTHFENKFKTTKSHFIILLILGFIALLGAALPYYMVGRRSFQAFGFMSRDNVLFPLPIGWIIAALFCIILKIKLPTILQKYRSFNLELILKQIFFSAFAALIVSQSLSNWRNHADWQAHYAYYRSAIEKISQDKLVVQSSIIQVIDELPGDRTLQKWKYPAGIWTEIISAAFQKTSRLATPLSPKNGHFFTQKEINQFIKNTELAEIDFMLKDINLQGQQIRLIIKPINNSQSPIRLALAYWRARFFVPTDMPKLMNSLTIVKSEIIK